MIVGLAGAKRSGKDTAATYAVASLRDTSPAATVRVMSFARRLKDVCMNVYGLEWSEVDGAHKERPFVTPVRLDLKLSELSDHLGLDVLGRGLIAHTPRQLLQYIGTEYVRSVCDSYWVDVVLRQYNEAKPDFCFVTDVRFQNEVEAIRGIGGLVFRIYRPDLEPSGDVHRSENVDAVPVDGRVENSGSRERLGKELVAAIRREGDT